MAQSLPTQLGPFKIVFTRRRYPGRTFTWVSIEVAPGRYEDIGDPWPCVIPAKAEVLAACQQYMAMKQQET
jgi:hypothetical protein